MQTKEQKRKRRKARIRAKISGTAKRPRLSVFKSNKHLSAQLIDDTKGHTLLSSFDTGLKESLKKSRGEVAVLIGKDIALKAKKSKITKIVFDRGGFSYEGNIKVLAESIRKEGLKF